MEKKPSVTVIVPVYNVENYLKACMQSVLAQSFRDFELILVDDGSTDGSGLLCDEWEKTDPRVRVLHQENKGLSAARNAGIEAAAGESLIFLDSDDFWEEGVLESLWNCLQEKKADLVLFPLLYMSEDGQMLPSPPMPAGGLYEKEEILEMLCRDGSPQLITAVNRLARRVLWEGLRFPEGRVHEDEYIAHRLYDLCERIAVLEKPHYCYLQRTGSITRTESPARRLNGIDAFLDRAGYLAESGREALVRPTLGKAMHYYLTLLEDYSLAELEKNPAFSSVRTRYRSLMKGREALFTRKEQLALVHPQLWRTLHGINHRQEKSGKGE